MELAYFFFEILIHFSQWYVLSHPILNYKIVQLISPFKVTERISVLLIFGFEWVFEAELIKVINVKLVIILVKPHSPLLILEFLHLWKVLCDLINVLVIKQSFIKNKHRKDKLVVLGQGCLEGWLADVHDLPIEESD